MATTRRGLATVEAGTTPAYQRPGRRLLGTSWQYPGFGRDPELNPVMAPTASTVVPPVTIPATTTPATAAPTTYVGSGAGDPGNGGMNNAGFDMATNPSAYADRSLQNAAMAALRSMGLVSVYDSLMGLPEVSDRTKGGLANAPTGTGAMVSVAQPTPAETLGSQPSLSYGEYGDKPSPATTDPAANPGGLAKSETVGTPTATDTGVGKGGAEANETPSGQVADIDTSSPNGPAPGGDSGKGEAGPEGGSKGDTASSPGAEGQAGLGPSSDSGGSPGDDYQKGGYTGAGPDGVVQPDQPAGTVHEGEIVIPNHMVQQGVGMGALAQIQAGGGGEGSATALTQTPLARGGNPREIAPFHRPQAAGAVAGGGGVQMSQVPLAGSRDPREVAPFHAPYASGIPGADNDAPGFDLGPMIPGPANGGAGMSQAAPAMSTNPREVAPYHTPAAAGLGGGGGEMDDAMMGGAGEDDYMAAGMMGDGGSEVEGEDDDYADVEDDDHPYAEERKSADPFTPPDPRDGVTSDEAFARMQQLPPGAQQAVLQFIGSDPMAASAMLQVLGPQFQDMIATALKARGLQNKMMAQQQMAPQMGGGMPPGGGPLGGIR